MDAGIAVFCACVVGLVAIVGVCDGMGQHGQ
jgi:hypothetical protein